MGNIETIFLGIIQGLTEFLPVSSSGHLVFFQNILGFSEPALLLDCSLHFGTLIAVCLYFRADLGKMITQLCRLNFQDPHASLALWVIVGSVPTGLIGLLFKTPLESLFGSVTVVGFMLIVTGLIVALTRFLPDDYVTKKNIGLLVALAVGTSQGLAIIPGISRSGATIVCAMLLGMNREIAARFSFLLSIPAIIGALAIQINVSQIESIGSIPLLLGFVSAALVGLVALKLLMSLVKKGHLYYFAPYCWAIGMAIIIFS
ncbi:MAG TPA: undecaprenyl-diphosphate phosphatase [Desulfobacteraceae bacterium]|nr:undecaprenyl-diphosphate phosphatase [Desulfobacteraceae bacterium]HPJ68068.1 undecaprenyl-diphosphate phosphatase [Desulfobacteraceae bacterium]HPQ29729.1 undecaprenyl-diphosphate phosphatase [Desulfobacteraceae bacterium]